MSFDEDVPLVSIYDDNIKGMNALMEVANKKLVSDSKVKLRKKLIMAVTSSGY